MIKYNPDTFTYKSYEYELPKFVKAKTLARIIDLLPTYAEKITLLNKMYTYYAPIRNRKASIQHGNYRDVTKHRDKKGEEYGTYKSLVFQIKKLQKEVIYNKNIINAFKGDNSNDPV